MPLLFYGQYPRSEELVAATRALDRGRISPDVIDRILKKEQEAFLKLQESFPYRSAGLFHFADLLRPFQEIIESSKCQSLKRFYETNTFWRMLEVEGDLKIKENVDAWVDKHFAGDIFTLPFLFIFKRYSKGLTSEQIKQLLQKIANVIQKKNKGILIFFEPTIGFESIGEDEWKLAQELISELQRNIPVVIATTFYSIREQKERLYSLNVDGFGIDFYQNTIKEALENFPKEKLLLAGLIRTDSTLIESRDEIEPFLKQAEQYVPRKNIYITTSGLAELIPQNVMNEKMKEIAKWS